MRDRLDFPAAGRVEDLEGSSIFRINARAHELADRGRSILRLDAGEPDFDTPAHIKRAAKKAIDDGYTRYTPIEGLPELKHAAMGKLARDNDLDYAADEILVTCGAKQALFNACMALLHPGDEMIVMAPYWGSYPAMAKVARATPRALQTRPGDRYRPRAEDLEALINPRTRLVVLNSPNNPTGQIYDRETLAALGAVLADHPGIFVLSDDIYEHLRYQDSAYHNIVNARPELKHRTLVVNGVSKAYAMTGWRVGFGAGPAELIGAMGKLQGQSTSHTAAVSQMAAAAALDGDRGSIGYMQDVLARRRALVCEGLDAIPGVSYVPPCASFYCLPDFSRIIESLDGVEDDQQLADWLLEEIGVAMVPGSAFGASGCLRLSFAANDADVQEAMARLGDRLA